MTDKIIIPSYPGRTKLSVVISYIIPGIEPKKATKKKM